MPNSSPVRQRFEEAISTYVLSFPQIRDPRTESMRFPPMMAIYVSMVGPDVNGIPPTQAEFATRVLAELHGSDVDMAAAAARACRTYSACVQQHHWMLLLRERFSRVWWDPVLDMHHGVDVVVQERGWRFGFSVSVQTDRADHYKSRKARFYECPPFPVLDVKIAPREYTCGRFWLASPCQVEEAQAFVDWHLAQAAGVA